MLSSVVADLGVVSEAAIIEPIDGEIKTWSFVFYSQEKMTCQKSNILHPRAIKILVDNTSAIYGMHKNGNLFEVRLVKMTQVSQDKNYLFI